MNLLEVRTKLIELSGRFDLVADASASDFTDNGANFFIQQGQKYLDRKINIDKATARFFTQVKAGSTAVLFQHCRVIEEVWVADSTSRLPLKPIKYDELRGVHYPSGESAYTQPFSSMTQGSPLYYSPVHLRLAPESQEAILGTYGGIIGYMDVMVGKHFETNGVLILPPPDEEISVEVVGKFYSNALSADADESSWSVVYTDILLMAALRHIEVFNRNSSGVKDYTAIIADLLMDVDKDVADQESTGFDVMRG